MNFAKELKKAIKDKHDDVDDLLDRIHSFEDRGKSLSPREEELCQKLSKKIKKDYYKQNPDYPKNW
jgi:hypothetical protein